MKITCIAMTSAAMLTFFAAGAAADSLYAIDYPQSATLYNVSESTGAVSGIGPVGLDNIGDLTSDEVSTLWGIQITTNSLVTIDAATGAGTLGPTITGSASPNGAPLPIVSLAYDPFTGVMYGNTSVPYGGATADTLYSIDTTTGVATAIGTGIGPTSLYALGFGQDGNLYGVDGSGDLDEISTTTGLGSVIGSTGLGAAYDIASDPSNDLMYAVDNGTNELYTLDLGTGAATAVGPFGSSPNLVGLAVLGATPEPGTIVMLGLGLLLMVIGIRRKNNIGASR